MRDERAKLAEKTEDQLNGADPMDLDDDGPKVEKLAKKKPTGPIFSFQPPLGAGSAVFVGADEKKEAHNVSASLANPTTINISPVLKVAFPEIQFFFPSNANFSRISPLLRVAFTTSAR